MTFTIEQTDIAIREAFCNMEEGAEYVLNDFCFDEVNRVRKEYKYSPFKNKREYKFTRKGHELFVNNNRLFDFDGKSNLALTLAFTGVIFAFALALALQHNGFEKLNNDSCERKVAEATQESSHD